MVLIFDWIDTDAIGRPPIPISAGKSARGARLILIFDTRNRSFRVGTSLSQRNDCGHCGARFHPAWPLFGVPAASGQARYGAQ